MANDNLELDETKWAYNTPKVEPGRCFYDDHDNQHHTFYRFKQKSFMIGSYMCDMVRVYGNRIVLERDVRLLDLLSLKEMEPEDFDKLEKLALLSVHTITQLCLSTEEKLKQRHSRLLKKPKP